MNSLPGSLKGGFGEDEVILGLAQDSLALQTYAIEFWKPLPSRHFGQFSI